MSGEPTVDEVREQAQKSLAALRGICSDDEVNEARALVEKLRNQRDYELMGRLAEAVSRRDPKDAKNRRLYAQCLIETGKATAAIDLLQPLARRLPKGDPEFAEATGLLGRAYKQIFFDAGDKASAGAREALKKAIDAYRGPYELDPAHGTWHGVNLVALLTRARMLGMRVAPALDPQAIAAKVVATLKATPVEKRDEWFLPTLAEASLGLRDWAVIDENIRQYVAARDAKAFQIASTLRQFTEVWDLENRDERGRALVDMLRARLLRLQGGEMRIAPEDLQRVRDQPVPYEGRLEAILGTYGAQTYQWWKTGIERAASVAAIRQKMGNRMGTGFLVRAGDLGREPAGELLVLTNFHVVNEHGANEGLRPDDAEVVFEAADPGTVYGVAKIVWSSPVEQHDASLLRLESPVAANIKPLPIAAALPVLDDTARVYIIGHPGGRDLAFSFQDNELLDHEGPPAGQPQIPSVWRLHYRAPTEGGSSGSPVFNSRLWQVIALHHMGGKIGVRRLNGKEGSYGANEGIAMQSIIAAMRA
jgi:Trypsin-like peptidase domain/MAP3K TRAFs-binding domain/Tetratricopeptide repeat